MNTRKMIIATSIGFLALSGMALPAHAGTFAGSTTVSCSAGTIKTLGTINTTSQGTMSAKATSATQSSITSFDATSQNGNSLGGKSASSGQTVSWLNVLTGTYTLKANRVGTFDCNGIGFGNGNYTLGYSWGYVG